MIREKDRKLLEEQLLMRKQELLDQTKSSGSIIKELLSESTYDDMDYAEISSDSYNLNLARDKQLQEIQEIDLALRKIENKTYGACDMCDEQIGIKRLRIKPHARFCVECRPIYEQSLLEKEGAR